LVSFFFQAEDGIRDRNVTGVQTCALPICSATLDALAVSCSWDDFLGLLKGQGIDMRFNHTDNSDKIRGISFCQNEYSIAGSKLEIGRASCRERVYIAVGSECKNQAEHATI